MLHDKSYERHLPHQVPVGFPIFLTWNLRGSLPQQVIEKLSFEAERLERSPLRPNENDRDRKIRHAKVLFVKRDQSLDASYQKYVSLSRLTGAKLTGVAEQVSLERLTYDGRPMWLADPAAACEVVKSILWGIPVRYLLWSFVVMGNHVHCLLTPLVELAVITQGIKGFTSYKINKLQNSPGRVVWQDESFDHWARDEEEFHRIIEYIENNPVVAALCDQTHDWKSSSAFVRTAYQWKRDEPFPVGKKDEAVKLFESLLG